MYLKLSLGNGFEQKYSAGSAGGLLWVVKARVEELTPFNELYHQFDCKVHINKE